MSELVKAFHPDPNESNSARLARFLNEAAETLPETYIDRRIAAKIAFMQSRTPGEDSDWVKMKLPSVMGGAKKILKKSYNKGFDFDRIDGIRATTDSSDTARTELRRARKRVVSAIDGLQQVDAIVDVKEIKDKDLRTEVNTSRRLEKALQEYRTNVPQLPPGRGHTSAEDGDD